MPLLVLLTSTIVLTLLPGWRSYLAGLAATAGLLVWSYWPLQSAAWNYGAVVNDYITAMAMPFFWLAFVIAMAGKIAWLARTASAPLDPARRFARLCERHAHGAATGLGLMRDHKKTSA